MESKGRRNHSSVILSAALIVLALALSAAARMIPGFADWYTVHVYPVWVGSLGRLCGMLPFSLAEMLCLALPVLLIIDIIANRCRLSCVFRHLLLTVSLLLFLYAANCGVNYYSRPFTDRDAVRSAEFTVDELADFCEYISDRLGESDFDGYPDRSELAGLAREAMIGLSADYPQLASHYPQPKQLTFLSRLFSNMGVSGIYSPFTIEANINGEMPGMEKPFSACHELSHLCGYMNEGEANYIGWLACIGSDDPAFTRSGWLIAWSYAGSELRRVSHTRYSSIYRTLPDDAVRELTHNHIFWSTHETKASEIQNRVNNAYLRSNGVDDGIRSYPCAPQGTPCVRSLRR